MKRQRILTWAVFGLGGVALAGVTMSASAQSAGGGSAGSTAGSSAGTGASPQDGGTGGTLGGISSGGYGGTVSGNSGTGTSSGSGSNQQADDAQRTAPRDEASSDILDSTGAAGASADRTSPDPSAVRTGETGRAINSQNDGLLPGSTDNVTPRPDATPGTPDSTDAGASAAAAGSSVSSEPDRTNAGGVVSDRVGEAGNVVDSVDATESRAPRDSRGIMEGIDTTGDPSNAAQPAAGVVTGDTNSAARTSDRTGGSAAAPAAPRIDRSHNNVRVPGGNRNRPITTDSRRAGDLVIDPAAAQTMQTR